MKKIISILILAIASFTAAAQYRLSTYSLAPAATNDVVAASTQTSYATRADVAASTRADIMFYYTLISSNGSAMSATCSNPATARLSFSVDGTHWTNPITLTANGQSNAQAWITTNVCITNYNWVQLESITNGNYAKMTNHAVRVFNKVGL